MGGTPTLYAGDARYLNRQHPWQPNQCDLLFDASEWAYVHRAGELYGQNSPQLHHGHSHAMDISQRPGVGQDPSGGR